MIGKERMEKMAGQIDRETVEYISILAKLELSGEEQLAAARDMGRMLEYIDKLKELDTDGVEPVSHVFPVYNVFREDTVTNQDIKEELQKSAPACKDGAYKVPRTVE